MYVHKKNVIYNCNFSTKLIALYCTLKNAIYQYSKWNKYIDMNIKRYITNNICTINNFQLDVSGEIYIDAIYVHIQNHLHNNTLQMKIE